MGALTQSSITIRRPVQTSTGRDPDADERDALSVRAWLKKQTAERTHTVMGQLSSEVYKCRFRTPRSYDDDIRPGWIVEANGNEYEVKDATQTGRAWSLTLERSS